MRCDLCWNEIRGKGAGLPRCHHAYCVMCAQEILRAEDPKCPHCESSISRSDFKTIRVYEDRVEDATTLLWGFEPNEAMELVVDALARHAEQKNIEIEASLREFHDQYQQREAAYVQKLEELKMGLIKAKKKIQELSNEKKALEKDKHELQKKYAEKAAQKRKLGDALNELQQRMASGIPCPVGGGLPESEHHGISPRIRKMPMLPSFGNGVGRAVHVPHSSAGMRLESNRNPAPPWSQSIPMVSCSPKLAPDSHYGSNYQASPRIRTLLQKKKDSTYA